MKNNLKNKNYYISSFSNFLQVRRYYIVKILYIVSKDFMIFESDKFINSDDLIMFNVRLFDMDRLLEKILKDIKGDI